MIHFYKKTVTQSPPCLYVVFLGSLFLCFGSFGDHVCQTGLVIAVISFVGTFFASAALPRFSLLGLCSRFSFSTLSVLP